MGTFQDNTSYSFAGTTEWGPTHGDELPYLWILPSYGWSDTSTWSSLAKQHSQLLLSLWSSFTYSGRPSSEGVEWRPYTPGGEYLQMGDQAVMGFEKENQGLRGGETFWSKGVKFCKVC